MCSKIKLFVRVGEKDPLHALYLDKIKGDELPVALEEIRVGSLVRAKCTRSYQFLTATVVGIPAQDRETYVIQFEHAKTETLELN